MGSEGHVRDSELQWKGFSWTLTLLMSKCFALLIVDSLYRCLLSERQCGFQKLSYCKCLWINLLKLCSLFIHHLGCEQLFTDLIIWVIFHAQGHFLTGAVVHWIYALHKLYFICYLLSETDIYYMVLLLQNICERQSLLY